MAAFAATVKLVGARPLQLNQSLVLELQGLQHQSQVNISVCLMCEFLDGGLEPFVC